MRKLFGIIAMAAIAAVAGWNFSQSQNEVELSDLALANVEALAWDEIIVGQPCACVKNSYCLYYYPWEQWEEEGAFYN